MRTRLTELLGIKYPIMLAGMGEVGDVNLATAVTNAGALGILGSGFTPADQVRKDIRALKARVGNKPYGVNVFAQNPDQEKIVEIMIDEKVPIFSYGRGNPQWLIHKLKEEGVLVIPTVGSLQQAIRAEEDGAHAIMVQGMEGGGHTGYVTSLVLLSLVTSKVKVPVIGAGGFCDGKGLVAALALGAEGIAMGTRFAITQESPIHDLSKKRYLEASEKDTVVTSLVTGTRARGIKNNLTDLLEREGGSLPLWQAIPAVFELRRYFRLSLWQLITSGLRIKRASEVAFGKLANLPGGVVRYHRMIFQGDVDWGWCPCGQGVGIIQDIPTCQELVERIVLEAETILQDLSNKCKNGVELDTSIVKPNDG